MILIETKTINLRYFQMKLAADLVRRLVGGRDEVEPGARDQVQPHVLPRECASQPDTVPASARDGVDSNRVQECAIHGYRQMPDEHKKELGTYETVKARFWDQIQPHVLPRQ